MASGVRDEISRVLTAAFPGFAQIAAIIRNAIKIRKSGIIDIFIIISPSKFSLSLLNY